jgi:hypothetical protein
MKLADFLLARIAEDEAAAREAIAWRERDRPDFEGPDMERPRAWPDTSIACVLVGPEYVLAECEAKRRIVELNATKPGRKTTFRRRLTLQALAMPYAEHPDYDEGWKP